MHKFTAIVPDALIVIGVIAISCGAGLILPAAGLIVGGMLSLTLGVLGAMKAVK